MEFRESMVQNKWSQRVGHDTARSWYNFQDQRCTMRLDGIDSRNCTKKVKRIRPQTHKLSFNNYYVNLIGKRQL